MVGLIERIGETLNEHNGKLIERRHYFKIGPHEFRVSFPGVSLTGQPRM